MSLVGATQARKQLFRLVDAVTENGEPSLITGRCHSGRRWLCQVGVDCIVIDPASIPVDRKAKQRKTALGGRPPLSPDLPLTAHR